jgi:serine/threonine-protein kinase
MSDETGKDEVYVQRFPDGGGRHQISVDGGTNPVWSPDGTELFYRNALGMMTVAIQDARAMTTARPRLLYERRRSVDERYDVTPDGRYFIDLDDSVAELPPTELVVVQHFASELSRLAPPVR